MIIKIPYNIFLLVWCLAGVIVLGYDLVMRVYNAEFTMSALLATEIFWFLSFLIYSISYLVYVKKESNR